MPLSPTDRETIAKRASTIYERAAAVTPSAAAAAGRAPDPAALAAIRAWNQAFAPGDDAAFLARLAWDDLDLATVLAAAAEPGPLDFARGRPSPAEPAPWLDWLDRISDAARDPASPESSAAALPFAEIWRPFQRVAQESLDWPSTSTMSVEAIDALVHQLGVELARQGELAVFELFRRSPGYRAFVDGLLAQGLTPLFLEYSALARQLAGLTAAWVRNTRELLDRLEEDRAALAARFDSELGPVVSIEPGVSDPHHGRRRVAILQFASGRRLVYKPRSLSLDHAFFRLLDWLNTDLPAPFRILTVLDRGSHGWVEYAAHDSMADRTQVSSYFEQSGALMCVLSLLGAHDLHMENIVATRSGPVLVDVEMLLQPVRRNAETRGETDEPADQLPETSALDTGLLSMIDITAEGEAYDSGGLRGQSSGPLPFPARIWHGLGTDALHYVDEPTYAAAGRHEVRLDGVRQDPGEYADALIGGFERAYRSLLRRRQELMSPDGPLRAFAGSDVRVVQRPTNQYAMLRVVLSAPRYQRLAVASSTAVDVLHRIWSGSHSRPDGWEIAIAERRALERLDVPLFSAHADGVDLRCEGHVVCARFFAQSGLDAAITRAGTLSESDLQTQTARLARALAESITSRYTGAPFDSPSARSGQALPAARVIAIAQWVAHALLASADTTDGRIDGRLETRAALRTIEARAALRSPVRRSAQDEGGPVRRSAQDEGGLVRRSAQREGGWSAHRLYDGTLGPALFFAALAAVLDDESWRTEAVASLTRVERAIEEGPPDTANIGGADGLGSIAYGLTVAGSLLGDRRWLDLAQRVAVEMGPRLAATSSLDVVDGVAGAVLTLLAMSEATGDDEALRLAAACGDHLVARVSSSDVAQWPAASGPGLVGFAHGVAGIATALARLAQVTGEARYRQQAVRGWQFVADQFLPTSSNYPVSGAPGASRRAMLAWCHGAPGIIQGLGAALDICSETAMLSQVDAALAAIGRDEPAQVEHVCCGALGRVDALLSVGRALRRTDVIGQAWHVTEQVANRAVARGHFRLSGPGVVYRVYDPGFFRGLSGIGYVLLRLAAPDRLPSIAGFEPPRN